MEQRRAARFVKNEPRRRGKPQALVNDLGWESLQARRLNHRLSMLHKITKGLVEIPVE